MKRIFIMLLAVGGLIAYSHTSYAETEKKVCVPAEISSTQNVRAQEIKRSGNIWIKRYVNATYDSDTNKLYVNSESYTVSTNDLYQNVDDARGNYRYVAANFYFNL